MIGSVVFSLSAEFGLPPRRPFLMMVDVYDGICFFSCEGAERRLGRIKSGQVFLCIEAIEAALQKECGVDEMNVKFLEPLGVDCKHLKFKIAEEAKSRPAAFEDGVIPDFFEYCVIHIEIGGSRYKSYSTGNFALPWGERGNCNAEICRRMSDLIVFSELVIPPEVTGLFKLPMKHE